MYQNVLHHISEPQDPLGIFILVKINRKKKQKRKGFQRFILKDNFSIYRSSIETLQIKLFETLAVQLNFCKVNAISKLHR